MSVGSAARVYVDSNILIYVIEGAEPFRSRLAPLLDALDAGRLTGLTSDLTFAEVMVMPLASKNETFIEAYRNLLSESSALEIAPVTRGVLDQSARLRTEISGKLADGIHVATAVLGRCSSFISEDAGIKVPAGLSLVTSSGVPALLASVQATP